MSSFKTYFDRVQRAQRSALGASSPRGSWKFRSAACACGAQIAPGRTAYAGQCGQHVCACEACGGRFAVELAFADLLTFVVL